MNVTFDASIDSKLVQSEAAKAAARDEKNLIEQQAYIRERFRAADFDALEKLTCEDLLL